MRAIADMVLWTIWMKTVLIHRDSETDLTINHLTTSPVTNHVCEVNLILILILILYDVFLILPVFTTIVT